GRVKRHGPHQCAQKSSSTTCPLRSVSFVGARSIHCVPTISGGTFAGPVNTSSVIFSRSAVGDNVASRKVATLNSLPEGKDNAARRRSSTVEIARSFFPDFS